MKHPAGPKSEFPTAIAVAAVVAAIAVAAVVTLLSGCGGKLPETRYYTLASPAAPPARGNLDVAVDSLSTEAGYDDDRIVYRQTPYRLDYYQYHRWSAAPGVVIGGYLAQALDATGKFHAVVREPNDTTPLVIGGRVLALEEIDDAPTKWRGHVAIELTATDRATGNIIWTHKFDDSEPLTSQTPEGLARAISTAMSRIVAEAAPQIADLDAHATAKR